MSRSTNRDPVFAVTYGCENCGGEWDKEYPKRVKVFDKDQSRVYEIWPDEDGENEALGDNREVVTCPVCEFSEMVVVNDRNPLEDAEA